jgi:hypothetical protein
MASSASGHCGPITAECPAFCPASVISLMALYRLLDSDDARQAVGDVVGLYQEGKLTGDTFRYLGPRRRSEIEAGLVLAGFAFSHRVRPRAAGCARSRTVPRVPVPARRTRRGTRRLILVFAQAVARDLGQSHAGGKLAGRAGEPLVQPARQPPDVFRHDAIKF